MIRSKIVPVVLISGGVAIVVLAALSLFRAFDSAEAAREPTAVLKISPKNIDLGRVVVNTIVPGTFTVTNTSSTSQTVRVLSSCTCLGSCVEGPSILQPGKSTEVSFSLKANPDRLGQQYDELRVSTSSDDSEALRVPLTYYSIGHVWSSPAMVTARSSGSVWEGEVELVWREEKGASFHVRTTGHGLTCERRGEIDTIRPFRGQKLRTERVMVRTVRDGTQRGLVGAIEVVVAGVLVTRIPVAIEYTGP